MRILSIVLFIGLLISCSNTPKQKQQQKETKASDQLGEIFFQPTGNEAAQPYFHKGLLLLHSFEYDDAREAFLKAQEADSTMVMAYWGEAMTYNKPLWRRQDYEKGRMALNKIGSTTEERLAKTDVELEKDFIRSVEILYGDEDKFERDKAYSEYLEKMHVKYPESQEAAAFYAISLLGSVPAGRDLEVYKKGAKVAQGIIDENPNHPGALHYLIHSYDDPDNAPKALEAANSYAKVAPDAAHALHMPSHIYVSMGMWDEVISSNIASWKASVKRMKDKELGQEALSYHALHWLMYGYLQKKEVDKAKQIMEDMVGYMEEEPTKSARSYMAAMKANYLVETGDWDSPFADIEVDRKELNLVSETHHQFVEGMQAYHQKDQQALQSAIDSLEQKRLLAKNLVSEAGVPMCSASGLNRAAPNQVDLNLAQIMEYELRAMKARLANDASTTEEYLKKAVELQDNTNFSYGPPKVPYPSYELYAEWLVDQDRGEEAKKYFEKALERGPKRVRVEERMVGM